MKSLTKFCVLFILSLLTSLILGSCSAGGDGGGSSNDTPEDPTAVTSGDFQGTWDTSFTYDSVSGGGTENMKWIISQSNNKLTIIFPEDELDGLTASGTTLNINCTWDDKNDDGYATSVTLTATGTLSGTGIAGTFSFVETLKSDATAITTKTGTLSMTKTSKSIAIPEFVVPTATITSSADWTTVASFITDPAGDATGSVNGTDIVGIKLAKNTTKMYGIVLVTAATLPITHGFSFKLGDGTKELYFAISYYSESWHLEGWDDSENADITVANPQVLMGMTSVAGYYYIHFSFDRPDVIELNKYYSFESFIDDSDNATDSNDNTDYFGYVVFK